MEILVSNWFAPEVLEVARETAPKYGVEGIIDTGPGSQNGNAGLRGVVLNGSWMSKTEMPDE